MMEILLKFVGEHGLAPLVGSFVALLLLTIAVIYVVAFIQGREVSFWPPKIGPGPSPDVKGLEKAIPVMGSTNTRFTLNCMKCGQDIKVSNPRLQEEPRRIYMKSHGSNHGSSQAVQIGCPKCHAQQFAQFEY